MLHRLPSAASLWTGLWVSPLASPSRLPDPHRKVLSASRAPWHRSVAAPAVATAQRLQRWLRVAGLLAGSWPRESVTLAATSRARRRAWGSTARCVLVMQPPDHLRRLQRGLMREAGQPVRQRRVPALPRLVHRPLPMLRLMETWVARRRAKSLAGRLSGDEESTADQQSPKGRATQAGPTTQCVADVAATRPWRDQLIAVLASLRPCAPRDVSACGEFPSLAVSLLR